MGIFVYRRQHSALGHILNNAHCLKTNRFPAGVWPGNNEDSFLFGQVNVKRHNVSVLRLQRFQKNRVAGVVPFELRSVGQIRKLPACLFCKGGFCLDEIKMRQYVYIVDNVLNIWSKESC